MLNNLHHLHLHNSAKIMSFGNVSLNCYISPLDFYTQKKIYYANNSEKYKVFLVEWICVR